MPTPLDILARRGCSLPVLSTRNIRAAEQNIPETKLMARAGHATAAVARHLLNAKPRARPRILVIAGPGNNGGDGLIAAQHLKDNDVRVAALKPDSLAAHPDAWTGDVRNIADALRWIQNDPPDLVIDALFGAGGRPLHGETAALADACRGLNVLSLDIPSGVRADSAAADGAHFTATATLALVAAKQCHVLRPARDACGEVWLDTLGLEKALAKTAGGTRVNSAAEWGDELRARTRRVARSHKYDFGHLLVALGDFGGAAVLASRAGLRVGAGLVTVVGKNGAAAEVLEGCPSLMFRGARDGDTAAVLSVLRDDERISAAVLGVGWGAEVGDLVSAVLTDETLARRGLGVVLDAGALTAFADAGGELCALVRSFVEGGGGVVMTPHDGEFARLADGLIDGAEFSRLERAGRLSEASGAVVVLKGSDCVVADGGGALISAGLVPWLATAGTGDVLSGVVGGLMATGMGLFGAAGAGVWVHGEVGRRLGPGMVSSDMEGELAPVMSTL
ncbi:MAG: NAD(P)H-hydrate dehydratase [Alphaproteobacteria bacterium]|nr:NAD(P)H-hydrate dehydratase [Alphaproteobacteria bacterium]MDA8004035.1 NAD(P)H-hydrate dehydratase [Alphaproteobacteria bacterium]MDA8005295.1 NAD(P)H-hydrate dehydratase [Alphaproteobacteria bacterium]MDA8012851.1 NAD(P)H-hydrate dehydratase [Alphaproteobacteria bacterium]